MSLKSAWTGVSIVAESFEHVVNIRTRSLSLRDDAFKESFAATLSRSSAMLVSLQLVAALQPSLDKTLRNILLAIFEKMDL